MSAFFRRLPPWLLLGYAAVFAVQAHSAHIDSQELGYPTLFLFLGAASSVLATLAVICYALRAQNQSLRKALRLLFPVAVIALLWGLLLDATVPTDYSLLRSGLPWLLHSVVVAAFIAPAYIIYFVYAHTADA